MLHSEARPTPLFESELRRAIDDAISGTKGIFLYNPDLLEKLAGHGVSTQDLLHVCRAWQTMTPEWDDRYHGWRYILEGPNLNGKWMRVVIARNAAPAEQFVAITGFRYSRGQKP